MITIITKQLKNDAIQDVKAKIVRGYRRGVCNYDGGDIPLERRGNSGRGSRFMPPPTEAYRRNYVRLFGDSRKKVV